MLSHGWTPHAARALAGPGMWGHCSHYTTAPPCQVIYGPEGITQLPFRLRYYYLGFSLVDPKGAFLPPRNGLGRKPLLPGRTLTVNRILCGNHWATRGVYEQQAFLRLLCLAARLP